MTVTSAIVDAGEIIKFAVDGIEMASDVVNALHAYDQGVQTDSAR